MSEAIESVTEAKRSPSLFGPNFLKRLSLLVAILSSLIVFLLINFAPGRGWLILADNTPTGGDMGAHVWGPAFMRDHLLSGGGLTGWTNDWYQGFPAYRFYMVVPALAIVLLNAGFTWWLSVPLVTGVFIAIHELSKPSVSASRLRNLVSQYRNALYVAAAVIGLGLIHIPYGISFKVVAVSGIVSMPMSAWGLGKLARMKDPIPAFLALATLVFLFDTNFTILGGNILSTLAGEFSFSISLSLVLLSTGMMIRAVEDRKWYGRAALLVALAALCHIIPIFFMVPTLLYSLFAHQSFHRFIPIAGAFGLFLPAMLLNEDLSNTTRLLWAGAFLIGLGLLIASSWPSLAANMKQLLFDFWHLALIGSFAVLIAGFWLVPFFISGEIQGMFNDMGWERLDAVGEKLLTDPMRIALPITLITFVLALVGRNRLGTIFPVMAAFMAILVANLGHGALWNERLLPFFYLSVYLSCAVGLSLVTDAGLAFANRLSGVAESKPKVLVTVGAFIATLFGILIPLHLAPFGSYVYNDEGDEIYKVGVFSSSDRSSIQGWSAWNFSGYEGKDSYREYRDVVETMHGIGLDRSCGRAMWEFDSELDRYGTPMALMLLPFWTDGCIASMEGLFFESSASTPFHFLNQSTLSDSPSRAQRYLPYQDFDINEGIAQLQASGVRYYMASSDKAIEAARAHPDLEEIDTYKRDDGAEVEIETTAFEIFEVSGSEQVVGLEYLPVVTDGANLRDLYEGASEEEQTAERAEIEAEIVERRETLIEAGVPEPAIEEQIDDLRLDLISELERESKFAEGWLGEAVKYYGNPSLYPALPAESGPADWPVASGDTLAERQLPNGDVSEGVADNLIVVDSVAEVTEIRTGQDWIEFEVDQIGSPVLVKTSFFPNWKATGAEGPFRAGPNQMAVIPTAETVSLRYQASLSERATAVFSILALLALALRYVRRNQRSLALSSTATLAVDEDFESETGDELSETDHDPAITSELALEDLTNYNPEQDAELRAESETGVDVESGDPEPQGQETDDVAAAEDQQRAAANPELANFFQDTPDVIEDDFDEVLRDKDD